jgi:hypothetical protein
MTLSSRKTKERKRKMKIKMGIIVIAVSVMIGALTIPVSYVKGSTASSQAGAGIELSVESDGFHPPKIEKNITGDPAKVSYTYDAGWTVSYVAIGICGFIGILGALLIRGGILQRKQQIILQA